MNDARLHDAATRAAAALSSLPGVVAIAWSGSATAGVADAASDVDLYVYVPDEPPLGVRRAVVGTSPRAEIGSRFFEPGDEWIDPATGVVIDAMYRAPAWMEEQLDRTLVRCEAWVGYTTCFWHNLQSSTALYDPQGWLAAIQGRAQVPYPEALRRAIVGKNQPLLRDNISSYAHQIGRALERGDRVSLVHRTAAWLASFFDVLFALNRLPHPGEKRLVDHVERRCPLAPAGLRARMEAIAVAAGTASPALLAHLDALADDLDALLRADGLLPVR